MRTNEQIAKAIKFRLDGLEKTMEMLEGPMQEKTELKQTYWSSYERHEELTALLNYVEDKNEQTGCKPKACGDCKSPCGSKS